MKILITGHRGMVGSALVREAQRRGGCEILTAGREALDLCDQAAVFRFLRSARPDIVVVAAAKVGGIHANAAYPAEFLYQNLAIASNLVHGSWQAGVGRLLFLGSSCIYPKLAPQPMPEDCLLASPLEPTNEAYAVAKIAGLKLCQHYRRQYGVCYHSAMPTNLYGPGDNYHPENSHVLPALIRRFHEAKAQGQPAVTVWGTGTPRREFLHVDDLADACFFLAENYDAAQGPINVGPDTDLSIADVAQTVKRVVGYEGMLEFDASKPDGAPLKRLDASPLRALGWQPKTGFADGLRETYAAFLNLRA